MDVREKARHRLAWLLFCSAEGVAVAAGEDAPTDWLLEDPHRREALLADADEVLDLLDTP